MAQKSMVKKEFYLYKKKEMKRCNSLGGEELYRVIPSDRESFLANKRKPTEKFGGAGENLCVFIFIKLVMLSSLFS